MKKTKFLISLIFLFLISAVPAKALMNPVYKVENTDTENYCLTAGEIIEQKFTSPVDNFGIIAVQFDNNNQINNDTIIFRIRRAQPSLESTWLFESEQSAGQFRQGWYFPFGFPPVENAKDKEYIFQIESTQGSENNCVSVYLNPETEEINYYVANEVPAKKLITADIQKKFTEDKIFFAAWAGVVLLVVWKFFKS